MTADPSRALVHRAATGARTAAHRTFRSLYVRNYRLYFVGQAVSLTGTWMQSVAQAWLVLQLTNSGVAIGLTLALQFGPVLLLGPWGGSEIGQGRLGRSRRHGRRDCRWGGHGQGWGGLGCLQRRRQHPLPDRHRARRERAHELARQSFEVSFESESPRSATSRRSAAALKQSSTNAPTRRRLDDRDRVKVSSRAQARNIASAPSSRFNTERSKLSSRSHRAIKWETCPSLRSRSEAAMLRSVRSPSFQPIHAASRRSVPPRAARIVAAVLQAAFATADTTACIFGRRPIVSCCCGWSVERGFDF